MSTKEFEHIIRIVGNDIFGEKKAIVGLTQIRGIGYIFAKAILDSLQIDSNTNIGFLNEQQVQSIEKIIENPISANFPAWFLNRRKDLESGKNLHLITSDIELTVRNDIEREKTTNSWRGIRHMFGLKVRGQRTRTTGRKGGAVGVKKGGKILPAGALGAPGAEGVEAPAEGEAPVEGKEDAAKPTAGKEAAAKPTAGKEAAAKPTAGKEAAAKPAKGEQKK